MFQYHTLLRAFFLSLFTVTASCAVFFLGASFASATTYEITGWGWAADDNFSQGFGRSSGGLGWVSFSNKSDSTAVPYGVFIDGATGNLSGYAWSANIGWITFNALEMQKCATNPGDTCLGPSPMAHMDMVSNPLTGAISGTGLVTGWARSCSVFLSGCSGAVRPDSQTGTWDGWISLSGAGYGLQLDTTMAPPLKFKGPVNTGFFSGATLCTTCFAWGGQTAGSNTGLGWGMNLGGLNVTILTASIAPLLSFWADQTVLVSGQSTNLNWITSANIVGCTAASVPSTPIWTSPPPKPPALRVKSLSTGPLSVSQKYTLQCWDALGNNTPVQTVNINLVSAPMVINGACGAAAGVASRTMPATSLCASGNAGPVIQVGDTWTWSCNGFNGGTNASCVAPKKKAVRIIAI